MREREQALVPARHIDRYKNGRYWSAIGFCDWISGPFDHLEFVYILLALHLIL
jgi:hypothetical protein